jgi:aminodeoxyfutalosine synthase
MPATTSAPARFRDRSLAPLWDKVRAGERLSREDGLTLFASDDLHGLGRMADHVKSARHGDRVFFVLNRYVNPTNVCVLSCSFCDFARKPGEAGAFENSIEDVLEMIKPGTREAHIVGGTIRTGRSSTSSG